MTHYITIIRYYFSYYFSYYDTLFFIIFPIIFNYDRVLAPGKWEGADSISWPNHGAMTHKGRRTIPAQLQGLEGAHTEWKAAWGSAPVLLYALFFLLYALFVLAEQDCCHFKCVLGTAFLCTPILCVTTSFWNIGEAANAVWSAQTFLLIFYYFALYHYSSYCNYFFNYIHYSKTKSRCLGWNSLQMIGKLHHPSRGIVVCSIQQRRRLNLGPQRCLLPQQGRLQAHRHLDT